MKKGRHTNWRGAETWRSVGDGREFCGFRDLASRAGIGEGGQRMQLQLRNGAFWLGGPGKEPGHRDYRVRDNSQRGGRWGEGPPNPVYKYHQSLRQTPEPHRYRIHSEEQSKSRKT